MSSRIGQPGRGFCGAGRCQFAFSAFFLIAALCMAGIAVSFHFESEEDPRAKRVAEYDDVVSAWTGTHRAAYASKWQGASSTPNFTITRGTTDDPSPVAGTFDENTSGGLGLDTSSQEALGQYGADVGKYSQGMIVKAKLQGFHTNPYKTEDEFQITLGSIAGGDVRTIRAKAYRCEVADYRGGTTKKPRHMYHAVPMHLEQVTLVEKSNDADEGVETTLPACPYRWAKKLATPAAHLNNYKAAKADCDAIGRIPLVNADVEIVIRSPNDPYIAAATIAAKYGGAGGEPGVRARFRSDSSGAPDGTRQQRRNIGRRVVPRVHIVLERQERREGCEGGGGWWHGRRCGGADAAVSAHVWRKRSSTRAVSGSGSGSGSGGRRLLRPVRSGAAAAGVPRSAARLHRDDPAASAKAALPSRVD